MKMIRWSTLAIAAVAVLATAGTSLVGGILGLF
jgi:hypothetical protein